jgi:broad specificity phosphatase PhoE
MRVYLVRHGETEQNAAFETQHRDVELSEKGIQQATLVAERFAGVAVDLIYSSPFPRAKNTAEIINQGLKKEIVYSELLCELKKPSEIEGTHITSEENKRIRQMMLDHLYDPMWHYSDEENFYDFKARVMRFLHEISSLKVESVLVVTHGAAMLMLLLLMQFGEGLGPDVYLSSHKFFWVNNTGITLLDNSWNGKWWLISWNDHGHLGYFYK